MTARGRQEPPTVTVLVPTSDRGQYLAECLDSILAQTLPAAQIIVVNDGSEDCTRQVIKGYPRAIDYLETDQLGKPGAINRGLELVRGEYLWIFDDDDVAFPDALERLVQPLLRRPEYGFSFSSFLSSRRPPHIDPAGRRKRRRESPIPDLDSRGFLIPLLEANFLGGAALFARTACYGETGPFDPRLIRSQDYEMAIRIARRYRGVRVDGGPTFHYRQHGGMRGPISDRFPSHMRLVKWLEYDQIFFRELYRTLPLTDYLPPSMSLEGHRRLAMLQRMRVMASKLLGSEVLEDLRRIGLDGDSAPLTGDERRLIRKVATKTPYYKVGGVFDRAEILEELNSLAAASPAVRRIRRTVLRARAGHLFTTRNLRGAMHITKSLLAPGSRNRA
ncbi:MAG: glycosyltransferase [Arenicellales bacterium]